MHQQDIKINARQSRAAAIFNPRTEVRRVQCTERIEKTNPIPQANSQQPKANNCFSKTNPIYPSDPQKPEIQNNPVILSEKTNPIHPPLSAPSSIPIAPHSTPKTKPPSEKTNPISTPSDPRIRQLYYLEHAKLLK